MSSSTTRRLQGLMRSGSSSAVVPLEVNVAVIGPIGAGKSALVVKYITKRFIGEYDPFLEDTYVKTDMVDNQDVVLSIMDTCEKEGRDPSRYLAWANVIMVVYSITDRASFQAAERHLQRVVGQRQGFPCGDRFKDIPVVLVGTKLDLERHRQVTKMEGLGLATRYGTSFLEATAAEEYESVRRIFQEAVRDVLREHERAIRSTSSMDYPDETHRSTYRSTFRTQVNLDRVKRSRSPSGGRKESRDFPPPLSPSPLSPSLMMGLGSQAAHRFSFLKGRGIKGFFHAHSS